MRRLRLLGPVDVLVGADPVALGPPKQRLLLALLANRRGRTVPTDELVEQLWDGTPPASAAVNLRSYIHGLRRVLGADAVTGKGQPGYTLALPAEAVDIEQFLAAARDGEAALASGQLERARTALHRAQALWRGRAFEGFEDVEPLRSEAAQLEERRLVALERRIDADLYAGASAELVVELTELTAQHPYREHLHAQLIVAFYRCGRQADALAAYRAIRETLGRDLGIDPGAELRQLELTILRGETGDPWTPTGGQPDVPSELPVTVSRFTGREAEFARLDAMVGTAAPILAIVGPGGVGKTALALRWAHRVASTFPDGQLFVDLRGFHTLKPISPADALGRFLRALNVAPERVPESLDEAAALYRSLMYGRRGIVVLDNAVSADQVRPLLPAGAGCLTLITSRNRMTGLVAHEAATHLPLGPLSAGEGVELLASILGPDRVRDEPDAAAAMVDACAGLPLALRIAAANLAEVDGRRIADYLTELRSGRRLDRLRNEGDDRLSVRAAFDLSYAALSEPVRRLFAMIGLVPGPDLTAETAAALIGGPVTGTAAGLERLASIHLLERRGPYRYAAHDLAREYARERASDLDPAECGAALSRLLAHYSGMADAALPTLDSTDHVLPEPDDTEHGQAEEWLRAELPNLVAACEYAADHGPYEQAWLISDALRAFRTYLGDPTAAPPWPGPA